MTKFLITVRGLVSVTQVDKVSRDRPGHADSQDPMVWPDQLVPPDPLDLWDSLGLQEMSVQLVNLVHLVLLDR